MKIPLLTYCYYNRITFVIAFGQLRREPSGVQITHTFCEIEIDFLYTLEKVFIVSPKRPIFYIADIAFPSSPKFVFVAP